MTGYRARAIGCRGRVALSVASPLYTVAYAPSGGQTKPSKAKRVKPLAVSNLSQNVERRSHGDELALKSVDYGDFRSAFRRVATNRTILYIADLGVNLSLARKMACGNRAWGSEADGFHRTEATDLLKTKDGARDRTQYEPISEKVTRRKAVGGRSYQLSVFSFQFSQPVKNQTQRHGDTEKRKRVTRRCHLFPDVSHFSLCLCVGSHLRNSHLLSFRYQPLVKSHPDQGSELKTDD